MAQFSKSTDSRTLTKFMIFLHKTNLSTTLVQKNRNDSKYNKSTKVCSRNRNGKFEDYEMKENTGEISTRVRQNHHDRILEWPKESHLFEINYFTTYFLPKTKKDFIMKETCTDPNSISSRKTFLFSSRKNPLYNTRRFSNSVLSNKETYRQLRKIHIYPSVYDKDSSGKGELQPRNPILSHFEAIVEKPKVAPFEPVREEEFEKKPKTVPKSDKCKKIRTPCPGDKSEEFENKVRKPASPKNIPKECENKGTKPLPKILRANECKKKVVEPVEMECDCECKPSENDCFPCELKRLPKVIVDTPRKCVPTPLIPPCTRKNEIVPSKDFAKLPDFDKKLPPPKCPPCMCKPKPKTTCGNQPVKTTPVDPACDCECKPSEKDCFPCELKRLPKVIVDTPKKCVPSQPTTPCTRTNECVPSKDLPKLMNFNEKLPPRKKCPKCSCKPKAKKKCESENSSSKLSSCSCPDSFSPEPPPPCPTPFSPPSPPAKAEIACPPLFAPSCSTSNISLDSTACPPLFSPVPAPLPASSPKMCSSSYSQPCPPTITCAPSNQKKKSPCPPTITCAPPNQKKKSPCPPPYSCPPSIKEKKPCPKFSNPCISRKVSLWQKIKLYFKARPNCPTPDEYKRRKMLAKIQKMAKKANLGVYDPCDDPRRICKEVERRCCLVQKQRSEKRCIHTSSVQLAGNSWRGSELLRSSVSPSKIMTVRGISNQNTFHLSENETRPLPNFVHDDITYLQYMNNFFYFNALRKYLSETLRFLISPEFDRDYKELLLEECGLEWKNTEEEDETKLFLSNVSLIN